MSNYVDVYFSRVNHLGSSVSEIAQNAGTRSFERWLAESPHTVDLSVERGLYFKGIILTNKDDESKKTMFLNVGNNIPIQVGDIVNWQEGSVLEKWLIFKKERRVNEPYQVFTMVRCNYLIKWIDGEGHLQDSWCYFVSSLDSKIKENFRTWHALITPQPNKYAEMILPRRDISRKTRFIVEDEGWYVVESDFSSVPGVMYLSLTEEKVNQIYDDLENDIADMDKKAVYKFVVPESIQKFKLGEEVIPEFYLTKNGKVFQMDTEFISNNKKVIKRDKKTGKLMAIAAGEATLDIQLVKYPEYNTTIKVSVGLDTNDYFYLVGNETIKLDREQTFTVDSTYDLTGLTFELVQSDELAKIVKAEGNSCTIHANAKNQLGDITLIARLGDKELSKVIKIVPLW